LGQLGLAGLKERGPQQQEQTGPLFLRVLRPQRQRRLAVADGSVEGPQGEGADGGALQRGPGSGRQISGVPAGAG
jgi:hypothetical protein